MKRFASLVLVSSLVAGVSAAPERRSIDRFGGKLHAEVARSKTTAKARANFVYSPVSIAIALAMTREGARDQTAAEMDAVLGAGTGAEARALVKALAPSGGKAQPQPGVPMAPELAIANRLFGERTTRFEQAFLDVTRDGYGAPIEALDFKRQHEASRAKINAWVEQQTKSRIKNLLAKGDVVPDTRLVLVNAIYLKAQWMTPFEVSATRPSKFTVEGAGNKQVATMRTQARGSWGAHAGARMLDLPYAAGSGPRLSMLLVVPDGAKLDAVEAAYAKEGLAPFLAATATRGGKVNVALPRFKVEGDFDLSRTLEDMGMPRAFSDFAEFGGISKLPTKISKVKHKAWIQVDEKGTEAAAATAVSMVEITSADPRPVHDFAVDRSFLFFIHDDSGNVLFGGRVVDPS